MPVSSPISDIPQVLTGAKHRGLAWGVLDRMGLLRTFDVWGNDLGVPLDVVPHGYARWHIRNGHHDKVDCWACLETFDHSKPTIEIGAGIGLVSCTLARLSKATKYVCVEPNPGAAHALLANIHRNDVDKIIQIIVAAIGYEAFPRREANPPWTPNHPLASMAQGVPVIRLGDVAKHVDEPGFNLLLDVEGAEISILQHEIDLISKRASRLVVETHPQNYGPGPAARALDTLADAGFRQVFQSGNIHGFTNTNELFESDGVEEP